MIHPTLTVCSQLALPSINSPHDHWQTKPPSICVGQPGPLNPGKHLCPESGSGCVCMSVSMSSRGQSASTHWHIEGSWVARQLSWGQYFCWCDSDDLKSHNANDSGCLQLCVSLSPLTLCEFATLCTCILKRKHNLVLVMIHSFPSTVVVKWLKPTGFCWCCHIIFKKEDIEISHIMHVWKRGSAGTSSSWPLHPHLSLPTAFFLLVPRQRLMTLQSGLWPISPNCTPHSLSTNEGWVYL